MQDPIQVYENHAGPIPFHDTKGRLHYKFVAYRDAEADTFFYGYGNTEEDAISDYVRQVAEDHCANCPQECDSPDDCILTNGHAATATRIEIEQWHACQSNTHSVWRVLNSMEGHSHD